MQPDIFYAQQIDSLQSQLSALLKKKMQLGLARFFSMLSIFISIYFVIHSGLYIIIALVILLAIFIRLVYIDAVNRSAIQHTNYLLQINKDELKALAGDHTQYDPGTEYIPKDHSYANDIDILGKASLFQYINRTTSDMGAETLAGWLLQPATTDMILNRQDAVKELSSTLNWQQELQAFGKEEKIRTTTKLRLQNWLNEETVFIKNNNWQLLKYLAPATIIIVIVLNIFSFISSPVRNYFLLAAGILAYFIAIKVVAIYSQVSKMANELDVMTNSIQLIENATFKTTLLQHFQSSFLQKNNNASAELKELKNILARFDYLKPGNIYSVSCFVTVGSAAGNCIGKMEKTQSTKYY